MARKVHVVVTLDHEDALTAISLWVGLFKNIQHLSLSDEEHDLFEPDAAIGLQFLAFRVVPGEILHQFEGITSCALEAHVRDTSKLCPFLCPLTPENGVNWYNLVKSRNRT